jgi:uncharacterized protein YjeT (DUF2065 family)
MAKYGDSPMDAKRIPALILVGLILVVIGIIVFFYAIYCIVMWGIGDQNMSELPWNIIRIFIGGAIIMAGVLLSSFGLFGKLMGGRRSIRRMLY